jgi:hypothetical protein
MIQGILLILILLVVISNLGVSIPTFQDIGKKVCNIELEGLSDKLDTLNRTLETRNLNLEAQLAELKREIKVSS